MKTLLININIIYVITSYVAHLYRGEPRAYEIINVTFITFMCVTLRTAKRQLTWNFYFLVCYYDSISLCAMFVHYIHFTLQLNYNALLS